MTNKETESNKSIEQVASKPVNYKSPTQNASWTEWWQATKTIRPDEFRNIDKIPCARQSLMYGIAGGAAVGCTRYLTSNPFVASNWAVASFVLISAASWQRCRSIQASQRAQIQAIREQLARKSSKENASDNAHP